MAAVSSLNFNVYEQYTSGTDASGTTSQSGSLQAGVTVGTDDGSSYGSAIILDVDQAPASKKLAEGVKAVNTLTEVANYARTQAPKDAAASRLAQAIGELRTIDLATGGIRAVQEAVRVAQDIASAVRDLANAEEAIAADGGPSPGGADGAGAGAAAAAAISAALSGSSSTPSASLSPAPVATAAAAASSQATSAEAGYSGQVGSDVTGLIAAQAGLGSGPQANQKVSSGLAQAVIAELQATGLPVDAANLTGSLQDLIANPLLGAQELQAGAKQAGLDVTVATSLDVQSTLTDPRDAAAPGVSAAAGAAAIDDPYDELIGDAVAALAAIGKGLKKALPTITAPRPRSRRRAWATPRPARRPRLKSMPPTRSFTAPTPAMTRAARWPTTPASAATIPSSATWPRSPPTARPRSPRARSPAPRSASMSACISRSDRSSPPAPPLGGRIFQRQLNLE